MHQTPNVVEATNKPGLFGKLEDIQSRWEFSRWMALSFHSFMSVMRLTTAQDLYFLHTGAHPHWVFTVFPCRLSLCEKALAEYLDTKRLAFPRFYFISSADLLDILSNGTNPHQVAALMFAWGGSNDFFMQFSLFRVKGRRAPLHHLALQHSEDDFPLSFNDVIIGGFQMKLYCIYTNISRYQSGISDIISKLHPSSLWSINTRDCKGEAALYSMYILFF